MDIYLLSIVFLLVVATFLLVSMFREKLKNPFK